MTKIDITTNSALIEQTNMFLEISFQSMKASHFFYLTSFLILVLFLFIRIAPRKTGLAYLFLSIRTFLELLISIQDVKNNTLHLWFSDSPFDGAYRHSVEINSTFLLVMLLLCCSLLIQGLILLILPSKLFTVDFYLLKYKNQKHKYWIENIIVLVPIVIFSTGIGNFLFTVPFFENGRPTDYRTYKTYLFIAISVLINSILFYCFLTIKEPYQGKADNINKPNRKVTYYFILINISWFLLLCFYGIMFWNIQKHITVESLIILIFIIVSLILGFIISYLLHYASTKTKSKKLVNSEKKNVSNSTMNSKRKFIQILKIVSILIIFNSPLVCVNFISNINAYPSNIDSSNGFGFNMLIERYVFIQDITVNSNGSFNMEINVDYNFSNVIEQGKETLVAVDGFVIDTNYDLYYDVYTNFSNLSAIIASETGNYSIITYKFKDAIAFREEGSYIISGFANITFSIGITIALNLAFGRFKDLISIISPAISTSINS